MALSRKQKKAFLTVAVTAGVYLSFRYLLPLIFPFLAAYLMALLLQPSAAFLEKRLRISFRGRMIGVPIGMIGGVELILLSIFLVGLLAAGGRRFTEELEHFLEEFQDGWKNCHCSDSNLNSRSSESFICLPVKSGSSFAEQACRAVDRSRRSCCRSSFRNQFLLRRGLCARLLWLFYFSLPRF